MTRPSRRDLGRIIGRGRKVGAALELQRPIGTGGAAPRKPYDTSNRPRTTTKASGERGPYDTIEWKRASAAFLRANPICSCGCGQRATIVDHAVPWRQHPGGFWDQSNWSGLARSCHSRKSRIEQGQDGRLAPVKRTGPKIKGCDPKTGMPLDPEHPWNKE